MTLPETPCLAHSVHSESLFIAVIFVYAGLNQPPVCMHDWEGVKLTITITITITNGQNHYGEHTESATGVVLLESRYTENSPLLEDGTRSFVGEILRRIERIEVKPETNEVDSL